MRIRYVNLEERNKRSLNINRQRCKLWAGVVEGSQEGTVVARARKSDQTQPKKHPLPWTLFWFQAVFPFVLGTTMATESDSTIEQNVSTRVLKLSDKSQYSYVTLCMTQPQELRAVSEAA